MSISRTWRSAARSPASPTRSAPAVHAPGARSDAGDAQHDARVKLSGSGIVGIRIGFKVQNIKKIHKSALL